MRDLDFRVWKSFPIGNRFSLKREDEPEIGDFHFCVGSKFVELFVGDPHNPQDGNWLFLCIMSDELAEIIENSGSITDEVIKKFGEGSRKMDL